MPKWPQGFPLTYKPRRLDSLNPCSISFSDQIPAGARADRKTGTVICRSNHSRTSGSRARARTRGALAFSRTGDPTTGEFQDAVILAQFEEVDLDLLSEWEASPQSVAGDGRRGPVSPTTTSAHESTRLTCFRPTDPHKQRRLALCSHSSGPIGEVSRLVAILSRKPNGQSYWTFRERNLLLGAEGILGRGTRRRQQRQFDGLFGFSRRLTHQYRGRRGAAGDTGHSRRPRRSACPFDGRGVPARRFGRCGRNRRT
jgi:hypothetical protein